MIYISISFPLIDLISFFKLTNSFNCLHKKEIMRAKKD